MFGIGWTEILVILVVALLFWDLSAFLRLLKGWDVDCEILEGL